MIDYMKVQSNGNNFLLLDNRPLLHASEMLSQLAIRDCNVKIGIGADGILVIEPSDVADFKMRIINSNGFESEMCGNGARCIARYAYEKGIAPQKMSFETLAGIMRAEVIGERVKLQMGEYDVTHAYEMRSLVWKNKAIEYYYLEIGVPHVVILCDEMDEIKREDFTKIGAFFDQNHAVFKNGTNVNFVLKRTAQALEVTTYERGVEAITDSCGTGSCASVIIASEKYDLNAPIEAINPGGINRVYFEKMGNTVQITLEGMVYYAGKIECTVL